MKRALAALLAAAGCAGFTGPHDRDPGGPRIEVGMARAHSGSDQALRVTGLARGEIVDISWFDASGRLRGGWRKTASRGGAASVSFDLRHAASGPQTVVATRLNGRAEPLEAAFVVRDESAIETIARPLAEVPPYLSVDPDVARARAAAHEASGGERLLSRSPCLSDRPLREEIHASLIPRLKASAAEMPSLWSLGRDAGLAGESGPDYCRSVHCSRGFARFLHKRYTDPLRMGLLWRRQVRSFASAEPYGTSKIIAMLGERGAFIEDDAIAGGLVSWGDHRRYMNSVWTDALADLRALVRKAGSGAPVGLEGVSLPSVLSGAEPERMLSALDWVSFEPDELSFALARGFGRKDARFLIDSDDEKAVLRGAMAGAAESGGRVQPASNALDGGVEALLTHSTWEPDPVLVLYSHRSVELEWLVGRARGEDVEPGETLRAWIELLGDIGISPMLVSSRQVLSRSLARSGARALILPRATVLSDGELSEIARFARAGGLVVADSGAGLLDEWMSARHRPEADRLFGIERPARTRVADGLPPASLEMRPTASAGAFTHGVPAEGLALAEVGVRATSGRALGGGGGCDALVWRRNAVYLNLDVKPYRTQRGGAAGENLRRLVANVLEVAQVRPRVEVVSRGRPVAGCRRLARRLEETEVHAMWLDPELHPSRMEAELVFDEPGYCFDSLRGVLLGRGDRVAVRLHPGANVFSWTPYDVAGIGIRARERGGEIRYEAVLETSTGNAGTHIVRQSVTGPDGREIPGGSRAIVAGRGVARGSYRFALDEPPGVYNLVLRDATTGVEGLITLVREAPAARD